MWDSFAVWNYCVNFEICIIRKNDQDKKFIIFPWLSNGDLCHNLDHNLQDHFKFNLIFKWNALVWTREMSRAENFNFFFFV